MRALVAVVLSLGVGCSRAPVVRVEDAVACGKAIDALDRAQEKSDTLAAAEFKGLVSSCLGTLVEKACAPLAQVEAPAEAMKACLVAYCPRLPQPKPELCLRPVSHPADVAITAIEFALAARRFDVRTDSKAAPLLAPFETHLAAQAYSRQRWGCGRAGWIVRVERERLELVDGPTLKSLGKAEVAEDGDATAAVQGFVAGGGCNDACVAVATDVKFGRLKQVLGALGACGASAQVSTFDPKGNP